jgi:EAL domain-containing protein (putative c-di-GMP-specific phosphodiesterase class I)
VEADDLGEASVEEDNPATAKRFVALGVRVTGEGIETASQLATLIELDCKHGQGFLLGRPAPADKLAEMLQAVSPAEVTVAARLARLQ